MTLRNVRELENYSLRAKDGLIGEVRDFYFDDVQWTIRYLVVETSAWLKSRQVLIAPESLFAPEWDDQVLPVRLTREQVKNSPNIDTAKPVSRQHEAELRAHYGWPVYWGSMYAPPPVEQPPVQERQPRAADPHLRSTSEIIGDRIEASDGEIGHVHDALIDDAAWRICYLVVDTRNWWPGAKVVISPWWVTGINWAESKIEIEMSRSLIKSSPAYDPHQPIDTTYADKLHDYYGKLRQAEQDMHQSWR